MTARLLALAFVLCLLALPAAARESAPVRSDNITARIALDQATATPGGTVTLAFVQEIREGWHTYWRNPGDSGAPANLAWDLPEGSRISDPLWPIPEAIPYYGLMTYGHHDQFVLLHELTLPDDWPQGAPFPIRLAADWLVCAEICIPESGSFALDLETGAASTPADAVFRGLIETARAALPGPSPWPTRFNATASTDDGATLRLAAALDIELEGLTEARFFPYTQGLIDQVADQPWSSTGDGTTIDMALAWPAGLDDPLEGVLVLTEDLPDGPLRQAFVIEAERDSALAMGAMGGAIGMGGLPGLAGGATPGLLELALLALIGGILLNLMPCVFPILSIKALSLVQHAGSPPAGNRSAIVHGLAYTTGVLLTFLALAGLLIALKATGALIGWGFQLQEPLVVAFLAYLMFVIGIWLFGGLDVGMGRLMGLGQNLTQGQGLGGSFATGVLAVFVASPCTAPFMAGAIGLALTRDAPTALAVFAALGLGLALPYLALSISPQARRRLPRPGPWMGRFRQFMAFPMFATAAWLVWVLAQQAGDTALLLVLLGFVAIAMALWAFRLDGRIAKTAGIACLALALGLGVLPSRLPAADPSGAAGGDRHQISFEGPAEPFSAARLAELRAQDRPVLVNMTAAWCLTCLVNEGNALSGETFRDALARNDAAYLKGDWTRRDPAITTYLRSFERAGVPLYVVYPAAGGEPTLLPQLLTEGMVRDALDRAANGRADTRLGL